MNKGELIQKVSDETNMTQKQIDTVLSSLIDTIKNQVASGDKVTITGFGTFEKRHRKARTGRNPRTGEAMQIEASSVPAFSAGKQFKDTVKDS
jgi:DNA-binding protein HU-beta